MVRSRYEIYCDILYRGLNNIIHHPNDPKRCLAEADHLHNIPELLGNIHNERLHRYYWEALRPSFVQVSQPEWLIWFKPLWDELAEANQREANS